MLGNSRKGFHRTRPIAQPNMCDLVIATNIIQCTHTEENYVFIFLTTITTTTPRLNEHVQTYRYTGHGHHGLICRGGKGRVRRTKGNYKVSESGRKKKWAIRNGMMSSEEFRSKSENNIILPTRGEAEGREKNSPI